MTFLTSLGLPSFRPRRLDVVKRSQTPNKCLGNEARYRCHVTEWHPVECNFHKFSRDGGATYGSLTNFVPITRNYKETRVSQALVMPRSVELKWIARVVHSRG